MTGSLRQAKRWQQAWTPSMVTAGPWTPVTTIP